MLITLIVTPTLPADTNGGIYYSGTNKGLPILTPGIITSTTSIFVYKETTTIPLNCISERMFSLLRFKYHTPTNINSCSAYTLPVLNLGQYRTALAVAELKFLHEQ
jgi:hypothetical protein